MAQASEYIPDFEFFNHGSLFTLDPVTEAAVEWCNEHLPEDATRWGNAYVIEPRYFGPIAEGIVADGLSFD